MEAAETQIEANEMPRKRSGRPKEHYWVRVSRINEHPENQHDPISVNCIGSGGKLRFHPNTKVRLTVGQINVLKDAVEDVVMDIPEGSGIYDLDGGVEVMKAMAEKENPGMQAKFDIQRGLITLHSYRPRFMIEYLNED